MAGMRLRVRVFFNRLCNVFDGYTRQILSTRSSLS